MPFPAGSCTQYSYFIIHPAVFETSIVTKFGRFFHLLFTKSGFISCGSGLSTATVFQLFPFARHSTRIPPSTGVYTGTRKLCLVPELDNPIQVNIRPEDIEMQVYRSSGAGGQHINKTSSAVRLIHKPTGIVVNCQTQRSQFQNRDYAMEMLKAKLYQIAKQQHMDKIDDIKGVQNEIAWGHQIRSYVFMPYTMVKDHRTNYETGNVDAVMDGDLDGFIFAYLKAASRGELQDT